MAVALFYQCTKIAGYKAKPRFKLELKEGLRGQMLLAFVSFYKPLLFGAASKLQPVC